MNYTMRFCMVGALLALVYSPVQAGRDIRTVAKQQNGHAVASEGPVMAPVIFKVPKVTPAQKARAAHRKAQRLIREKFDRLLVVFEAKIEGLECPEGVYAAIYASIVDAQAKNIANDFYALLVLFREIADYGEDAAASFEYIWDCIRTAGFDLSQESPRTGMTLLQVCRSNQMPEALLALLTPPENIAIVYL